MFFSIILPALIIISLGIVIVFLAKKAPAVKKIEEIEPEMEGEEEKRKKNLWKNFCFFCSSSLFPKLKEILIRLGAFIWKTTKNIFKNIFSKSNKDKTEKRRESQMEEDPVMQKIRDYNPDSKKENIIDEDEKNVRPMISDKVTTPRSKTEMKDRFEDILVERIASNPRDIEAYERLGEYYFEIGELSDSKECFKQVVKLDRTNQNAKSKLRKINSEMLK